MLRRNAYRPAMDGQRPEPIFWWQRHRLLLLLVVLSAVPLLYPPVPPLIDLYGHIGRYRVQLAHDLSPSLSQFYSFDWRLIGNLGVDLLVEPLAPILGLEPAVKLIVMTIPPLTALGLIWIAREVHGRVPPTVFLALPFAYGHPFHFGFVNFALSMALALNAFALWLRLARLGRTRLRVIVFLPISVLLWVTHTYGWGTLGVMAFSAEVVRQHDRGSRWLAALVPAALQCLSLAPPALLMVAWRSGSHVAGQTFDWFNWTAKSWWLTLTLRDRWRWFDIACVATAVAALFAATLDRRLTYSRNLAASALVLTLVFALLPRVVFGSAYADMRLTPFLFAVALIAIRPTAAATPRFLNALAIAGLAFFAVRTAATTASLALYSQRHEQALDALDHVPVGARLLTFVGTSCGVRWATERTEHLPSMAIVRRDAFANDQWAIAGNQLIGIRLRGAAGFDRDPSELIVGRNCREPYLSIEQALTGFPRAVFDYVWLIGPPPYRRAWLADMDRIWTDGRDSLYRSHRLAAPAG